MLNERQRHILHYLTNVNSYTKTSELARNYQTSERTIRNDLFEIENFVIKKGVNLQRSKRDGVLLIMDGQVKETIINQVNEVTNYQNRLSPLERMTTILGMLVQKNDALSSKLFSDLLHVSRRTILDDLKTLDTYLEKFHVKLTYLKNKGFIVEGNEGNIRRSYKELSNKFGDGMALDWLLDNTDLSKELLSKLQDEVSSVLYKQPQQLTDIALQGLIVHIAIAVQRLKQGNCISIPIDQLAELQKHKEFQIAKEITEVMKEITGLDVPKEEAGFITLHLLGAKTFYQSTTELGQELTEATRKLIAKVSFQSGIDFIDDEVLEQGLLVHLKPAIYRIRYHLGSANPMKSYIKQEYGRLVEIISRNIKMLEREFDVEFNEDEICYIALHFRAASERKEINAGKVHVLLVCGSGVGTVQLLKSRLNRFFPDIMVVASIPYHKLENNHQEYEIDYIISTVPIKESKIPSIIVNPFLAKEDREKISSHLLRQQETLLEERKSGPVLEEVLKPELIELNVEVDKWETAVRKGGELLVQSGNVEQRYVEAMVEMVNEHGPYVVLDKGVAMPHARPNEGVNHLCLSLLRLKDPVEFGHESNDPVHLVICLGSIDSETHLNALRQLIMILNDKESKEILMNGNKENIMEVIKQASLQ